MRAGGAGHGGTRDGKSAAGLTPVAKADGARDSKAEDGGARTVAASACDKTVCVVTARGSNVGSSQATAVSLQWLKFGILGQKRIKT